MCGFVEKLLPTTEKVVYGDGSIVKDTFLVLDFDGAELRSLQNLSIIIEQMIKDNNLESIAPPEYVDQFKAREAKPPPLIRDKNRLQEAHALRKKRLETMPERQEVMADMLK